MLEVSKGVGALVAILPAFNEEKNIADLVWRFPKAFGCHVVVVCDGSTDQTAARARQAGAHVLEHPKRMGCGPSIRTGLDYALRGGFDTALVVAGNGKDDPGQIERLLEPIASGKADFVQGSRYLNGGENRNMPLHRKIGTRLYSLLFSLLGGQRITDGTNGFRAFRLELLKDPRIDIWQDWLNNYEVESYLMFQSIRLGYAVTEAPVSKIYPPGKPKGYTKMRPFLDWWSHFRPALFLRFGLKH